MALVMVVLDRSYDEIADALECGAGLFVGVVLRARGKTAASAGKATRRWRGRGL